MIKSKETLSSDIVKPNILFVIIDSFRSDKFYGPTKTSVTPNIDLLIKNGTYFKQAISSADGTIPSCSSIFTAKYPFKTGVRTAHFNKLNKDVRTYFEILRKQKYRFYSYLPTVLDKVGLFPDFENDDCFYDSFLGISSGLGDKIITKLDSSLKEPWFFLVHAMDLHQPIVVPKEFDNVKFGTNYYEKKISNLDVWIGKILQSVDLERTILIITGDHGSYIRSTVIDDKQIDTNPNSNLDIMISKLASRTPKALLPLKEKLFFLREKITKKKKSEITKNLDLAPHEKRALLAGRADIEHYLFDEQIRIPLLFMGHNVPKGKIIPDQVRTVDIFPTLSELIEVNPIVNTDGRSLLPLMEEKTLVELPAYLESNPLVLVKSNDVIGIRTSNYKYFRDTNDQNKKVHLYDIVNDPNEDCNIQENNPEKVLELEKILQEILQDKPISNAENDDESEEIANELRKLGYL